MPNTQFPKGLARLSVHLAAIIGTGLFAIVLLASAGTNQLLAATAGPVKIGVITGVTGNETATGEATIRGAQIARDEINNAGGISGRKLEVVVEDNESRPAVGVDAAHKLIDVNKMPVIICGCSSGILLPIAEYAKLKNVIIVNPNASSALIRQLRGTIFSVNPLDDVYGGSLAAWAYQKGFRNIAILAPNSPYGVGQKKAVTEEIQRRGGKIVESVLYEQNQSDYRPDLERIAAKKPDVLLVSAFGDDSKLLFKQAIQIGLTVPWYAAYPTDLVIEDPKQADGRIFGLDLGFDMPTTRKFNAIYAKNYNKPPTLPNAVYTYDATRLVALAIQKGGARPSGIRQALPIVARTYGGATGKIIFDADGQRTSAEFVKLKITGDGKFVPTD